MRLWDYALRGVEAEAADKATKVVLRSFKADLGRTGFIPDQLDAQGYSYLAEKMTRSAAATSSEKAATRATTSSRGMANAEFEA